MYERFRTSLTKPRYIFKFVNDSFSKVFSYLLLLTFLMSLTVITISITNSSLLFPDSKELEIQLIRNFMSDDLEIIDNKFVNPNNAKKQFSVGKYTYIVGDKNTELLTNVIVLKENEMIFYLTYGGGFNQPLKALKYINNFTFTPDNSKLLLNEITSLYLNNTGMIIFELSVTITENFVSIIILALFLTMLSLVFHNLPIKFGNHFKISIYLITIWVFAVMISSLFNIGILPDIALFIVIIYQNITYRTAKVLTSIGARKNEKK